MMRITRPHHQLLSLSPAFGCRVSECSELSIPSEHSHTAEQQADRAAGTSSLSLSACPLIKGTKYGQCSRYPLFSASCVRRRDTSLSLLPPQESPTRIHHALPATALQQSCALTQPSPQLSSHAGAHHVSWSSSHLATSAA